MTDIRGLIVASPTPFTDAGEIDFDYVIRHLAFLREGGADGVVPCGTNGEGPSLSTGERKEMFRVVVENKGELFVVAGTGGASLKETIDLTRAAERTGADAALVVPPFFFKNVPLEGLYNYYAEILRSVCLPVFLYNIPQVSTVEITDELVERLLEFPNLAGVKDSAGDAERTRRYVDKFASLRVFYGADRIIEAMAGSGVCGSVSGIANAFPELILQTMKACEKGEGSGMQERVNRIADMLDRYPVFAANKAILSFRGFPLRRVRPPLVDLTEDQRNALKAELAHEGLV